MNQVIETPERNKNIRKIFFKKEINFSYVLNIIL